MKYFVWIKNNHGAPEAQLWSDRLTDGNNKAKETLFIRELPLVEQSLNINTLAGMYPYEAKE